MQKDISGGSEVRCVCIVEAGGNAPRCPLKLGCRGAVMIPGINHDAVQLVVWSVRFRWSPSLISLEISVISAEVTGTAVLLVKPGTFHSTQIF